MHEILIYNNIKTADLLDPERFHCSGDEKAMDSPEAVLVRSEKLHDKKFPPTVLAIGRAGMGVDNIPVEACTNSGIVVFNTPGANANAVKELVLVSMLLVARKILPAIKFVSGLPQDKDKAEIKKLIEKEKKQFAGQELAEKSLLVLGLGQIGARVATMAASLGMRVAGYDPYKKVYLPGVKVAPSQLEFFRQLEQADFISLHVDLTESTRGFFNANLMSQAKRQPVLLNFSRGEIVDEKSLIAALVDNSLTGYVTDFYSPALAKLNNTIILPHLGASTAEAEKVCGQMICEQVGNFLEDGTIINSVNFPDCDLPRRPGCHRLIAINRNQPGVIARMTEIVSRAGCNIEGQLNRSRGDMAYNILELQQKLSDEVLMEIRMVKGMVRVRQI